MNRTLEPELMLEPDQAQAYAAADFSTPHNHFVELCQNHNGRRPLCGPVLDLGCGTGDVTFRFARIFPQTKLIAVDGSQAMLTLARTALAQQPELIQRIQFIDGILPTQAVPDLPYAAIISNSLLHHLPDPQVLWRTIKQYGRPGTQVWIMDLYRPDSEIRAQELTRLYAAAESELLRRDFYHSLLAAFEPGEIRTQLGAADLPGFEIEIVSDRHVFVGGCIR